MNDLVSRFDIDGFVFPVSVVPPDEIGQLRHRFESELLPLWNDPTQETDYTFQTHMLFTWLDQLVRRHTILDAVEQLLGPDLLLWNSGFIVKPAHDNYFASWHQDLTYWGLEPPAVVTAWLAFTDSRKDNGCVRCIPGSHRKGLLPVVETHGEGNMLSRGQTIELDDAEKRAVDIELEAGEISLHHGLDGARFERQHQRPAAYRDDDDLCQVGRAVSQGPGRGDTGSWSGSPWQL